MVYAGGMILFPHVYPSSLLASLRAPDSGFSMGGTHSPISALDAEWKDTSSTVPDTSGPISNRTFL